MIKDNILLVGFIIALLLMVIIVNIKECGKPAPPESDPIEQIDSIKLRIDTIQITKIKTIRSILITSYKGESDMVEIKINKK